LANADYLAQHRDALPCVLRYGLADSIVVNGRAYAEKMPGVPQLSEVDITNILNYINHSWGNQNPPYRLDEVRELLQRCPK
jgi:mono/diheme cytochrome c family protein